MRSLPRGHERSGRSLGERYYAAPRIEGLRTLGQRDAGYLDIVGMGILEAARDVHVGYFDRRRQGFDAVQRIDDLREADVLQLELDVVLDEAVGEFAIGAGSDRCDFIVTDAGGERFLDHREE